MVKYIALAACLIATTLIWAQSPVQPHPLEITRGLERFNKLDVLPKNDTNRVTNTPLSIKNVKIGDNVLKQAISLSQQGGELGRIRGGSRSDKIKFNFNQAYEDTRLDQKLELYFNKHSGFIQQVTATYLLQDAYTNITPLREITLNAAVKKFGSPFTMQQAYDLSGQQKGEVKLSQFIKALQSQKQLHPLGLEYLKKRNVSRSSKWQEGEQGYALLYSGFDRCYLWQTHQFSQILTFCFFDKTGASPNSRGLEFDLHNFPISQQINELRTTHAKPVLAL